MNRQPSSFLVENIDLLPRGKALDIAMGHGRNAVYLASQGFDVEGVDMSEDAVDTALALAEGEGIKIRAEVADLEKGYCIAANAYDLIVCFNYLQRSLFAAIETGLKSGGMVVYETFIVDQIQFGRPRNPDHLLKYNELLQRFRNLRVLRYHEGIMNDQKAVAGIIAQKGPRLEPVKTENTGLCQAKNKPTAIRTGEAISSATFNPREGLSLGIWSA